MPSRLPSHFSWKAVFTNQSHMQKLLVAYVYCIYCMQGHQYHDQTISADRAKAHSDSPTSCSQSSAQSSCGNAPSQVVAFNQSGSETVGHQRIPQESLQETRLDAQPALDPAPHHRRGHMRPVSLRPITPARIICISSAGQHQQGCIIY